MVRRAAKESGLHLFTGILASRQCAVSAPDVTLDGQNHKKVSSGTWKVRRADCVWLPKSQLSISSSPGK